MRNTSLNSINNENFDLVVVGGGASGAGIALDAVLRGYKVLLVEKGDFASQTSSKSTKLIHGGVRYLEQAVKKFDFSQLKMVYKALHERKNMINNAPHLSKPLALITPCYSIFEKIYYGIGMKIYDLLAGSTNLKSSRFLTNSKVKEICPGMNTQGMVGGILYYDGQMNDARYNLSIIFSAQKLGAICLNYTSLVSLKKKQSKFNLILRDEITGENYTIQSKAVINATGPFSDHIRLMANPKLSERMTVSRGAHIVLDSSFFPGENSLLIPKTKDGRVIFVIPFRSYTLIGTTDDPDQLSENPEILETEKEYLLNYFNLYAHKQATKEDIKGVFVGQRPLVSMHPDEEKDTKSLVRDHLVEYDNESGLISILGGKWTTYRVMAEDTVDTMEKKIFKKEPAECKTPNFILVGGEKFDHSLLKDIQLDPKEKDQILAHWHEIYGSESVKVKEICNSQENGWEPILTGYPYRKGEIAYLKNFESVVKNQDIVDRRWGISLRDIKLSEAILKLISEE